MSNGSFKAFASQLQQDEALRQEVQDASDQNGIAVETLARIAAGHGFTFTADDVSNELSDAQLEGVAGGLARSLGRMDLTTSLNTSTSFLKIATYDLSGTTYIKIDG